MAKIPSPQTVIEKYLEDRERIKKIKRDCADAVAEIERFQRNREDFLLAREDMEVFGFMTDLYVNGRDGKAAAEKEKQNIGLRQEDIEKWLLKMLSKVGEGIKTEWGTVFKTRKESVSVESWDTFLDNEILRPMAKAILESPENMTEDFVIEFLKNHSHLEFLTHGVAKTSILEVMGEADSKTGSRPNSPPNGIKYVSFATVGVRKGK